MGGRLRKNIAADRSVGRVRRRHSTDILAMEDRELAEVLAHLCKNAYGPLHVRDLLERVPLSRRAWSTLSPGFGLLAGRRIAAAACRAGEGASGRHQLVDAEDRGRGRLFAPEIMNRVFRRELDQTPTQYRRAALRAKGN